MLLRKFSQTLKVGLALMLATFSTGILPATTAFAATTSSVTWAGSASASPECVNGQSTVFQFKLIGNLTAAGSISVSTTTGTYSAPGSSITGNGANSESSYSVTGAYNASANSAAVTASWNGNTTPTLSFVSATCTGQGTAVSKTPVTPMATKVSDITCDTDGSYSVTALTGVTYKVGGIVATGTTTVSTPGDVIVTAEFDPATYELATGAQTSFPLTFAQPTGCDGDGSELITPGDIVPGNNGTIKVTEVDDPNDSAPNNDPHVSCSFDVEFYNFDADAVATVAFTPEVGPQETPDTIEVVSGSTTVQLDDDGIDESFDGEETYTLAFTGTPHPEQGFHIRVTATVDESLGNNTKTKVFWVECPPQVVETPVTPVVQFLEPTCEIRTGRVVISTTTGVTYKIDGVVKTAGTYAYPASTTVTVTAEIQEGFVLDAGATAEWPPHTFAAVPTNCGNLLGVTDICPNIEGTQTVIPAGLIRNPTTGECFTPGGRGGVTPAQVLGAATALPETLPSTGGADSPLAIIIASILAYGAAYFLQGRRLLGRKEALSA